MPLFIKVPDSAWHTQDIVVGGNTYTITYKYNTRDSAWYVDILDANGNIILYGLKAMPNQSLTGRYDYLSALPDGNLWCLRFDNDFSPIDRDNLGIGKTYQLVWLTPAEEEEASFNGSVQL